MTTPEQVYDKLCHQTYDLLEADRAAIYRFDSKRDKAWCPKSINLSEKFISFVLDHYKLLPGYLTLHHDSYHVIKKASEEPALQPYIDLVLSEAGQTILFFPIFTYESSVGLLALYFKRRTHIESEILEMIQSLARLAGASLQKIHLLQDTQEALSREKKLNEINAFLSSAKDLPTILLAVVRMSAELVHADAGLLGVLIDPEMMSFYPHMVPSSIPLRPAARGRGVAWQIVEGGKPILTHDYFSLERAQAKWRQVGLTSFMGVPMQSGEECLGVLTLFRYAPNTSPFSKRDLTTLTMIAQQAATTIKNVRLLDEANHRANALANTLNRQEELDKLKNQFIQTASHELRSPLGIIYGHTELLESGVLGELKPDQMDSVRIIGRRVRMLNNLVNDLTALLAAETQELRRDLINTTLLVKAVEGDYAIRAKEQKVSLNVILEKDLPHVYGDQTHLQRVFDNLFSNAFKFTPAGGSITLEVTAVDSNVHFTFSDTGAGIAADQLPRIFERFFQVRKNGRPKKFGTGLGLALVKEIVEAHRGSVSVESQIGVGTTFTVILPGHAPPTNTSHTRD